MANIIRDRTDHADGVHYPPAWVHGTCTAGHDITVEANVVIESRLNRRPRYLMRCLACRRTSAADRYTLAMQQPRWATAIKRCRQCGQDFRPTHRDINNPDGWAARRYCGTACSSRGAKRGPTARQIQLPPAPNPIWRQYAACHGVPIDPKRDEFYPDGSRNHGREAERIAADTSARYCQRCPVRRACLLDALHRRDNNGVWGGTTAKQRATILKTGKGIPT